MKNIALTKLACVMALVLLATNTSAAFSFTDVVGGHPNSDAIEYTKTNNIISGYPDGSFKPDNAINRAEFTKIIIGAQYNESAINNCLAQNVNQGFFKDVPANAWFAKYVCMARANDVIEGYPDGSFGPEKDINFAEAAKMIANAFNYPVSTDEVWYKPFVEKLGEKKSIPTSIATFDQKLTRGEMAEMVYRLKANITNKPSATYNAIAHIGATPIQTTCVGNNASGGDGTYRVCVGNAFLHQPSGIKIAVLSSDESMVKLALMDLPGNNTTSASINNKGVLNVGGNNGYEVVIQYMDNSASSGASLAIASKASAGSGGVTTAPDPAPDPTPIVISNVPKKFLTLVVVNNGTEGKYESNGWEKTMKLKEDDYTTVFEVAMWDNGIPTNPKRISLYKFGRSFDPRKIVYIDGVYTDYTNGGPAWVAYRESFNVINVDLAQNASSKDYLGAFKRIMEAVIKNQPAEHYGIKYLGHGTGDGALFGWKLNISDSEQFLASFKSMIGKKIDFLDWNSQCAMGTYNVVSKEYRYADYIIASDLERGDVGVVFGSDGVAIADYNRLKPEAIYLTFFSPSKTIRQSLMDMVNSERLLWETAAWKNGWTGQRLKQSLSIYDTNEFENLANAANLSKAVETCDRIDRVNCDVLDFIKKYYPMEVEKFYDFRFHYISDKDFFPWDLNFNGFRIVL